MKDAYAIHSIKHFCFHHLLTIFVLEHNEEPSQTCATKHHCPDVLPLSSGGSELGISLAKFRPVHCNTKVIYQHSMRTLICI
jgi:hypothetical protein